MSFLKKLFGGGENKGSQSAAAVEHEGYRIVATPQKEGGNYRVCGTISKEIDGEIKEHTLIRADTLPSLDAAVEMTISKAKQVIAEQGEKLFRS